MLYRMLVTGNLMMVLSRQARLAEAVELGMQAVQDSRTVLGARHPSTVSLLRELSVIFFKDGDMSAAEPLLREAAQSCTDLWGEVHEETLAANMLLGKALAARGKLQQAVPILRALRRVLTSRPGWTVCMLAPLP